MKIMPSHRNESFRNGLSIAGSLVALITTFAIAVGVQDANAQATGNASVTNIKPPPLPNGSAQVNVKAGMSDEDWEKAYKETGRPKFSKNSVKKLNGNVQRD
ncbi:hypothetical protein E2P84_10595 [Burkholderia cepacia]|uniref:Uncharacterized protein n=2 Tax=Burkholderiaceae TaxID=119060 RepID=A0AAX2RPS8_BURCE|nr:hypothetical protein [Burkholderia cepacia]THJ50027.1 hypothetical protein E9536_29555 [Burkholderia sp. LS-044]MCA8332291.1 hypothetical protein [Burkholderia cepacia]RQT33756.1 hypothetical protein DF135_18185 [Burkholderia cepacia]RQT49670.1 hypothetical protein DF046_24145 [Burkholderia cepacia]RQZ62568.1 hypothetical protein DF057_09260 [Burkholderia cepacia]